MNIKLCVLLLRSPSEALQILEEAYAKVILKKMQVYLWHKHFCDVHRTAYLFCTTLYLHIGRFWSKSTLSSTVIQLWRIHHIVQTCHWAISSGYCYKKNVLNEQQFVSAEEVTAKVMRAVTEESERFQSVERMCHCPWNLFWRKCCVNRCMITYLCAIHQFRELFEATFWILFGDWRSSLVLSRPVVFHLWSNVLILKLH